MLPERRTNSATTRGLASPPLHVALYTDLNDPLIMSPSTAISLYSIQGTDTPCAFWLGDT
eukprot:3648506-Rhodomonas_salina.3